MTGNLLSAVLQYPSLAEYYLKHKYMRKCVMNNCALLCQLCEWERENENDEEEQRASYQTVVLFGYQILKNGILLNKSKPWRTYIVHFMAYIIRSLPFVMEETSILPISARSVLVIHWMIILFLYYKHKIPNKSRMKYEKYAREFQQYLERNFRFTQYENYGRDYNVRLMGELCNQLKDTMENPKFDGEMILDLQSRVWEMKKENMKCLWHECENKAYHLRSKRLYKCKRCRVARYCSKYCQKRDWNFGDHKQICNRFVELKFSCI